MATADTYVRARIDSRVKRRAAQALSAMGISLSDAIRLLMVRIASEKQLPFEIKIPNEATCGAMAELSTGGGETFDSIEDLMAELNAED